MSHYGFGRQYVLKGLVVWYLDVLPDEGGLWLALRVTKVKDQGQVAIVDSDTGNIDDTRDALLLLREH